MEMYTQRYTKKKRREGACRKVEAHTKIHQKAPPQAALKQDFCGWECVGACKAGSNISAVVFRNAPMRCFTGISIA